MDNDGDQDIYIKMGGAFPGDAYQSAFFMNPCQGNNHWITIQLQGTIANRDAIGSTPKIDITENGKKRTLHRDVNSGGSFGASPLRREIGVGQATQMTGLKSTLARKHKYPGNREPSRRFIHDHQGRKTGA